MSKTNTDAICYEIITFFNTFLFLRDKKYNDIEKSAFLESFLTHTRVLFYVFWRSRSQDDIIAQDVMKENIDWSEIREKKSKFFETTHTRIDKKLSHLTKSRLSEEEQGDGKSFDINRIVSEMIPIIELFILNAELPESCIQLIEKFIKTVKTIVS